MNKSNLETALMIAALPAPLESRADRREYDSSFDEHLVEAGRDRQETTLARESKADDVRPREAQDDPLRKDHHSADGTTGSQGDRATDAVEADDEGASGAATETDPEEGAILKAGIEGAILKAEIEGADETQAKNVRTDSRSLQTGQELSSQEQSGALPASFEEEPMVEAKEQVQRDEASTATVGKEAPSDGERQESTVVDGKAGNGGKALDTTPGDGDAIQQATSAEESQASKSASEQHDVAGRSSRTAEQASSASSDANIQNTQEKQGTRSASNRRGRRSDAMSRAGAGGRAEQIGASNYGAVSRSQAMSAEVASSLEASPMEMSEEPNVISNDRGDLQSKTSTLVSRPLDFTSPNTVRSDKDAQVKQLHIDPERFVARVAKAFRLAEDRGGQLRLRLSPPELGSVRLELAVKNGAVTATIETETAAARHALLDNLPALRDRLVEQNMRVEQFDVHVRDEGADGRQKHTTDNQGERHSPESENERSSRQGQSDSTNRGASGNSVILRGDETLNVMV